MPWSSFPDCKDYLHLRLIFFSSARQWSSIRRIQGLVWVCIGVFSNVRDSVINQWHYSFFDKKVCPFGTFHHINHDSRVYSQLHGQNVRAVIVRIGPPFVPVSPSVLLIYSGSVNGVFLPPGRGSCRWPNCDILYVYYDWNITVLGSNRQGSSRFSSCYW